MATTTERLKCSAGAMVSHSRTVEHVIRYMHLSLCDDAMVDVSLAALCRESGYSSAHLIGMFEEITGTTPHHFLASLRIQRAKELLLSSDKTVTVIAYDVGYESFPTFSRTFSQFVGVSPIQFRSMPKIVSKDELLAAAKSYVARNSLAKGIPVLEGEVISSEDLNGVIFVGTFTRGVPQGIPNSGTVLFKPGIFRIRRPSVARYHLMVAHVPLSPSCHLSTHFIGVDRVAAVQVELGSPTIPHLMPRPVRFTDPPLVLSLTSLLR